MKFDIDVITEEFKQEIERKFRETALLRQYNNENIERFKSELTNYLDRLEKERFIVESRVKRAKLPRKN